MVAASVWTAAGIALAGTALGAVLGFLAAEASDHLRRGREAKAGAVLVFQELVSAYSAARGVMEGFVTRPEELYLRRTAWEAHGGAIARSLSLDEANRVARAYGALDDLDRVLREGAPPSTFTTAEEREWLQTTILDDVVAGIRVVADLTSLDAETIDAAITLAEASPPGSMDS